jgi:chemotaxis protein CheY-P-specific phosphatase CheC
MRLTKYQKDALQEMSNYGTGKAANLLNRILHKEIELTAPELHIIVPKELGRYFGGPKNLVVCMFAELDGDMQGIIALLLSQESAKSLAELLLQKKKGSLRILEPEAQKQLAQITKKLSGEYLRVLRSFLGVSVRMTRPRIAIMYGAAVAETLEAHSFTARIKKIALLETGFSAEKSNIFGDYFLMLGIRSLPGFLKAIERKK